jgi:CRISPR system Cascade subunit CasE
MIYLSRLFLNPRSWAVRRDLANPYEMHRTIMKAYSKISRQDHRILYRLENNTQTGFPLLIVQSPVAPDWSFIKGAKHKYLVNIENLPNGGDTNPDVKTFTPAFQIGEKLAFRMCVNPTVKKSRSDKDQGQRVGIRCEEEQLSWLERKIDQAGAILTLVHTSNESKIKGELNRQDLKSSLTFFSVQFDGFLKVREPEKLVETLQTGIGSGKGFGFGLISLTSA